MRRRVIGATMVAAGLSVCVVGCGSAGRSRLTHSAERKREATMCRAVLSRTAAETAQIAGQAVTNRQAMAKYLSGYQTELGQVVRDLERLRSRVSDEKTVNLVIELDQSTERAQKRALNDIKKVHDAHLTRTEAAKLYGPIQRSEESAAVRLSRSTFPPACLGGT
jgi:predicted ATP-binding protein involved in virulence